MSEVGWLIHIAFPIGASLAVSARDAGRSMDGELI